MPPTYDNLARRQPGAIHPWHPRIIPPATAELVFTILVPDRDLLHLYLRGETSRMRYCEPLTLRQLPQRLSTLPPLAIVALAGNQAADRVSSILLPHRDLFVVPDPWLNHLQLRDLDGRARTTARLVHAHLLDPIQLRLAPETDDVPF